MRNRDLRPAAKANPTIQQAFERFQKYNRLKNLSQGSLDFYAAKGRSFFRFLGDLVGEDYKNWHGIVVLDAGTNSGKTYFILKTLLPWAYEHRKRILILYNREALRNQIEHRKMNGWSRFNDFVPRKIKLSSL